MKPRCFTAIIALLFCNLSLLATTSNDSIYAKELEEIVVKEQRFAFDGNKIVITPSKREKNLSNTPTDLLTILNVPFIRQQNGTIVGRDGQPITIFINGVRADDIDTATFWAKNTRYIEYIENPSDSMFEGERNVVNFIMHEYEIGGVTKLNLFQSFPNNGDYSISSKSDYKRMSYGILFDGKYFRDHFNSSKGLESYNDIYINGNEYKNIFREYGNNSFSRDNIINTSINARYKSDKFRATHTFTFNWRKNPNSGLESSDIWNINIFNSSHSYISDNGKNITPKLTGDYHLIFSNKWYMTAKWIYSYIDNQNSTSNAFSDLDRVDISTSESVNSLRFSIIPTFYLNNLWQFQLKSDLSFDWFNLSYYGTSNVNQTQFRSEQFTRIAIFWHPIDKIYASVEPGIYTTFRNLNHNSVNSVNPTINASLRFYASNKFTLGASSKYYLRQPSVGESSPVLIKTSELLWIQGDENAKNLTSIDSYMYSSYIPNSFLSFELGLGYNVSNNELIPDYKPAPQNLGGLIKYFYNAGQQNRLRSNFSIIGTLLNNALSFSLTPEWYYTRINGNSHRRFNYFSFSGDINYRFKNFRASIWYQGPYKDIDFAGMGESWRQDNLNASLTYGNGEIFCSFRIEDIFNKRSKRTQKYSSRYFTQESTDFVLGRRVCISFSYAFDYGKKVDYSIDIDNSIENKTSVISY